MQNFIFVSPYFPSNYENFCIELNKNGVQVLGIGDAPYDSLSWALKDALTEYYKVDNMEDYSQMYRAVAFFCFKYGPIDGLESNNEYWLEQDARLRTDFNIPGMKTADMEHVKYKSKMKPYYEAVNIPVARYHLVTDLQGSLDFIDKVGYPVIVKPDNGVGASETHKLENREELEAFHAADHHGVQFIMEEFVPGEIFSYDAIMDSKGEPLFETGNHTPISIMDSVNNKTNSIFYIEKKIADDLREIGRKAVKSFGVRSRFTHFEFFRLTEDHDYLGKKGTIIGLEVNYRPSGGYSPDMMNYANSTNVYKNWADMIAFDHLTTEDYPEKYFCVSVGLREALTYEHSREEVMEKYKDDIMMAQDLPAVLATAMGEYSYVARFKTREEMEEFLVYAGTLAK